MSLERIKSLVDTVNQMEEMKNKAIKGSTKDRRELRFDALKQIQNYFKDVAAIGNFPWIDVPCNIYWLNKGENSRKLSIRVHDGTVDLWESSSASSLRIDDFCNKTEAHFIYTYSDGRIKWEDGYVELIEQWDTIKKFFEEGLEKALIKKMGETQQELVNFKASYEVVANFKI